MSVGKKREPRNLLDVDPATFGGQLRRLRDDAGMTQAELGAAVGLPQTRISEYERNAHKPNEDLIMKLAEALYITPDTLFESTLFEGALVVGAARRQRLRSVQDPEWRLFDHLLDARDAVPPQDRAAFDQGLRTFLETWRAD